MSLTEIALREAYGSWLPYAFLTLILAALLTRRAAKPYAQRLSSGYYLFAIQLVLFLVTVILAHRNSEFTREFRIAQRITLAVAWVSLAGFIAFGFVLSHLTRRIPRIIQDLIVFFISFFFVVMVLQHQGVELSGLFATSAVVTAVLGLSLQDTLGNALGGLALQVDDSISVGDWVKVGDINGRVVEIRWRYTAIENRNGETVLLPNSALMKGAVTIVGRREGVEERFVRRWVKFNVDFRHAPQEVIDPILQALTGQPIPRVASTPAPDCILLDLTESYATYAVRYWLTEIRVDDPTDSLVRTRIIFALKRVGIMLSIPAHAVFLTEESEERKEAKTAQELQKRIEALRRVTLFQPLLTEDLEALAQRLKIAPFTRGEVITRQGAAAHWLYLVVSGEARVRVAKDGAESDVATLSAGDFFGEMGLLTGAPRSATVVAVTDTVCYRLESEAFRQLVQSRPEVGKPIAQLLALRQEGLHRATENLDAEASAERLSFHEQDLFDRMKRFLGFGQSEPPRS